MKFVLVMTMTFVSISSMFAQVALFPDGTAIPEWFSENGSAQVEEMCEKFVITDFGAVCDNAMLQTEQIQATIDKAAECGGVVSFLKELI